jgi:amino acid adenylation domain-containing protein
MEFNNNIPDPTASLNYAVRGTIFKAFLQQVGVTPDSTALVSCQGKCSYGELERISRQIANCLVFNGVRENDTVVILSDRNPALVYAMLGVARAGAAFNIADSAYPTARILLTLKLIAPALVLVCGDVPLPDGMNPTPGRPEGFNILRVPSATVEALQAFSEFQSGVPGEVDPAAIAYVTFTSGSTGQPKGIVTAHAPLPHFIDWHVTEHGFSGRDHFSLLSGLSHDPLLRDIFTPLSIGARLCIPRQSVIFDPTELVEWLELNRVTVCHLTPALGEIIITGAELKQTQLPALRHLFWGGDVLSLKTSQRLRSVAPNAAQANFYGATETPQAMAHYRIPAQAGQVPFPIGKGIADAQLLLVTEAGTLATNHEMGEIWIRTPYLAQGYLNDPDQTHARFVANPFSGVDGDICYRTGDLGNYLPDGNVVFAGRLDHQVKIRGFRIEPGEVACAMERFPGISRALVLAREDGRDGKKLVAYLTVEPKLAFAQAELLDYLRQNLPSYMIPSFVIRLDSFPLLPNGKIDLQALPPPQAADAPASSDYLAPCNAREAELAQVWQEILGIDQVGVNENFLALGGDSLSALKALVSMKKLGFPESVARSIFQGKTIREIVGEEGGEITETVALAAESRTNLLINILRGLLLTTVVIDHWFEGILNQLAGKGKMSFLLDTVAPLFNLATPGFAFVFGASLGYLFFTKYKINPKQTRKTMLFGVWLLLAGVSTDVILRLLALSWDKITPTVFFSAFFSPLLYYALALTTAPLWFWVISKAKREYLACAGLMAICYAAFHGSLIWLLEREQQGFLQLCRLMMVAKFNYFNMSMGTLGGVMVGIYLKRHYRDEIARIALLTGLFCMALGMATLYFDSGSFDGFYDPINMDVWRWIFYSGLVLVLASGVLTLLMHFAELPAPMRKGLQIAGVLGQCTFPIFVLHGLVLRAKLLFLMAGLPMWAALAIPFSLFFLFCGWIMYRIHQLYYGKIAQ